MSKQISKQADSNCDRGDRLKELVLEKEKARQEHLESVHLARRLMRCNDESGAPFQD